jgi:tRNA dimethylallyltransferase
MPSFITSPADADSPVQLGLLLERPELDRRIDARVGRMWAQGFEREVRELEAIGLRDGRTASRALGYQQMLRYLDGEWTLDQAREETARATRRFARRQESWFRRDPRVNWLPAGDELLARALRAIHDASPARDSSFAHGAGPAGPSWPGFRTPGTRSRS